MLFVVHCDMLKLCKYNLLMDIFANEASRRSWTWLVISLAKKERTAKKEQAEEEEEEDLARSQSLV